MRQRGAGFFVRTLKTESFGFNFGLAPALRLSPAKIQRNKSLSPSKRSPKRLISPLKDVGHKKGDMESGAMDAESDGDILAGESTKVEEDQPVLAKRKRERPRKDDKQDDRPVKRQRKKADADGSTSQSKKRTRKAKNVVGEFTGRDTSDRVNSANAVVEACNSSAKAPALSKPLNIDEEQENRVTGAEVPKKRGRPRKVLPPKDTTTSVLGTVDIAVAGNKAATKRKGRPPKAASSDRHNVPLADITNLALPYGPHSTTAPKQRKLAVNSVPIENAFLKFATLPETQSQMVSGEGHQRDGLPYLHTDAREIHWTEGVHSNEVVSNPLDVSNACRASQNTIPQGNDENLITGKKTGTRKSKPTRTKSKVPCDTRNATEAVIPETITSDDPYESIFNNPAFFEALAKQHSPLTVPLRCRGRPPKAKVAVAVTRDDNDMETQLKPKAAAVSTTTSHEPLPLADRQSTATIPGATRTSKRVAAEASRQRLKEIALREATERQKDEEDTRQRLLLKKRHASSAGRGPGVQPKKRGRPPLK